MALRRQLAEAIALPLGTFMLILAGGEIRENRSVDDQNRDELVVQRAGLGVTRPNVGFVPNEILLGAAAAAALVALAARAARVGGVLDALVFAVAYSFLWRACTYAWVTLGIRGKLPAWAVVPTQGWWRQNLITVWWQHRLQRRHEARRPPF
jgi:hypothetical protein